MRGPSPLFLRGQIKEWIARPIARKPEALELESFLLRKNISRKGLPLILRGPVPCPYKELQANRKSAARKRSPVNHARTRPQPASQRFDQQQASWLPHPLRHNASPAKADVLRRRRFCNERLAQAGQSHRLHCRDARLTSRVAGWTFSLHWRRV